MKYLVVFIFSLSVFFFFIFFFRKCNFLIDKKLLPHKSFTSTENVLVIGGFIIMLYLAIFNYNLKFYLFCSLIFILGILSDLFFLKKPSIKLILQSFIVISFLFFFELRILSTKIFFLDYFLENKIFSISFTMFCLLILMNGSNFIDGVNTLLCGYYLLVLGAISYISYNNNLIISNNIIELNEFIIVLLVIYIFNFFSKLYLGDSGAFLLSFVIGYYLIDIVNKNIIISPFFVILLLWYPAFENFFSILRKILDKSHPSKPDNFHLHQLLFIYFKIKINKKNNLINTLTGNFINFYNFLIFFLGVNYFNNSKFLIILIFLNIFVYLFIYFFLKKNLPKKFLLY